MKRLLYFLSSIQFTLVLLAITALLTGGATLIESSSGSNALAREKIFSTLFFQLLLLGFFINIFAALLKRLYLRQASSGFIAAHIGLILLITGVALKEHFGFQAYLILREGEEKAFAFQEESLALSYLLPDEVTWKSIPLDKKKAMIIDDITLHVASFFPNGQETYLPFLAKEHLHIHGQSPLPYNTIAQCRIDEKLWSIVACKEEKREAILKTLTRPFILFLEGKEENNVIAFDQEAIIMPYSKKRLDRLYAYQDGFKGYTIPFSFFNKEMESPLMVEFSPQERLEKREEERPLIRLTAKRKDEIDKRHLLFNKMGQGLPTPFLVGSILISFEPKRIPLPHKIRLRRAETHYSSPDDKKHPTAFMAYLYLDKTPITLSMNEVVETKEGLRYFLASISPQDESDVKTVKLIVNYDPFKYWLTYPGSVMIALGGLLLFFRKPLKKI